LLDVYTALQAMGGNLKRTNWLLSGDLKYGRTIHSLLLLLKRYEVNIFLVPAVISSWGRKDITLDLGDSYKYLDVNQARDLLPQMDVIYLTRIQEERIPLLANTSEINCLKIGKEEIKLLKPNACILHPGPRGPELSPEVDHYPQAWFHEKQVHYGLHIRKAILQWILKQC